MRWIQDPIVQQVIAGLILAAIVGALGVAKGWWKHLGSVIWQRLTRRKPKVPRETVRLVPSQKYSGCRWDTGRRGETPVTHFIAHFFATNITDDSVLLLRAYLRKPRIECGVMTSRPSQEIFGQYPIPPGATSQVSIDGWIEPALKKKEGDSFAAEVVVVDQFGNEHESRVEFTSFKPMPIQSKPKPESIYSLDEPIEKDIVAVLNSEISRYEKCGRRVGGFGSVFLNVDGRDIIGFGVDGYRPDVPKNQVISENPESAVLKSDNLEALLAAFGGLKSSEEQDKFVSSLLNRIDRDGPYASVGYFIVLALWELGGLGIALERAKLKLHGDKEYGYSNVLYMLNGLLRYRHPDFSNEELEEIERRISGVDEHKFGIEEKIAAIRAARLLQRGSRT